MGGGHEEDEWGDDGLMYVCHFVSGVDYMINNGWFHDDVDDDEDGVNDVDSMMMMIMTTTTMMMMMMAKVTTDEKIDAIRVH